MFSKSISGLEITGQAADYEFENITGDQFGGDCSFLATLRLLLHERAKGMKISLRYNTSNYDKRTAEGSEPDALVRDMVSSVDIRTPGLLYVKSISGTEDAVTAVLQAIDSEVARNNTLNGFEELELLSKFLGQRKFRSRFFINSETKSTVIFAERMDFKRWHLLQSIVSKYMPWFFEGDQAIAKDSIEFALIKSLTSKESDDYERIVREMTAKFDLRTAMLRGQFKGFETRADEIALNSITSTIDSTWRDIARLHQRYAEYYKRIEDCTVRRLGLEEKIRRGKADGDSEFLKFLLRNRAFNLVEICDASITFIVTTVLSNFDPDAAERMIANHRSYLYNHRDTKVFPVEKAEKLLRAIFTDEKIKLRLCAAFTVDFGSGSYSGREGYRFPAQYTDTYLPNQHIQRFGCLGGNDRVIEEAMLAKDYVGVISACISSAANMGLADVTVGNYFASELFGSCKKIYELPDGTLATPVEAMTWLDAQ